MLKGPKIGIHNKYKIEKIDKNGDVVDTAYATNIITNSFWTAFFTSSYKGSKIERLYIGTGTGTVSASDTGLFEYLAYADISSRSSECAYPTSTYTLKATFAASTAIGSITEVSLRGVSYTPSSHNYYISHALLVDSEGNPTSIEKTDTDIIIATCTIYVTFTISDSNLVLISASNNTFLKNFALATSSSSYNGITYTGMLESAYLSVKTYASSIKLGTSASVTSENNSGTISYSEYSTANTASNSTIYPDGYFLNYIVFSGLGFIELPNSNMFAPYMLAPISCGTGDGATTSFRCPIPEFIEGTDVVTVGSVELVNGVDYTVDPLGNYDGNDSAKSCCLSTYALINNENASISGGGASSRSSISNSTFSLIPASFYYRSGEAYPSFAYSEQDDNPLVFDFGEDVTCNDFFIEAVVGKSGGTASIFLEYSSDNTTWAEAVALTDATVTYVKYPEYTSTYVSSAENNGEAVNVHHNFTEQTARYWRIRTVGAEIYYGMSLGPKTYIGIGSGDGIVFTTPPADGAEILISAQVDRPYKSEEYKIISSYSVGIN